MKVKEILKNSSSRFTDKAAIIFRDKEVSFRELFEIAQKLSKALLSLGLSKSDKVVIFLPNGLEYVYAYLSIFCAGAVVVPFDARLSQEEIIHTLNHCEAKFLISSSFRNISFADIAANAPLLKNIIFCASKEEVKELNFGSNVKVSFMEDLLINNLGDNNSPDINDDDLCAIFYTSGTTSKPKGVMWNYRHLDAAPKAMEHFVDLSERDIKLCCLPLSHIGGLVYLQNCIVYGITLILMEQFIPPLFLKNIERYKITCMHLVPTIFSAILNIKEFENTDLSSLRWVVVFGAPNNPVVLERFNKYCPQAKLLNGYGLTETAAPNTASPFGRVDTVGKIVPWMEIAILDEEDNHLTTNEVGQIALKGWPIMRGYFKEPELTESVIKNGWFYTGDLGRLDKEGFLYIVGREKDMIKVGGLIVYSAEVEGVLANYPGVVETAVVGVADELRGEKVKACVVAKKETNTCADDIKSFCRKHLTGFKVPDVVEFYDSLPKTPSGKIQKELLK